MSYSIVPDKQKAITTKTIRGHAIDTIQKGTEFEVSYIHEHWSCSHNLGITQIWNDEYKLMSKEGV